MGFPCLISMRSHRETIAAKDDTIAALREMNTALLALLGHQSPAAASEPAEQDAIPAREKKPATAVDLASIDPADNHALAQLAVRELGTRCSLSMLQRKVEQIRHQVKQARTKKKQQREQPGVLAKATQDVPSEVTDRINAAIEQGKADARV